MPPLPFLVYYIVDSAQVVALEYVDIQYAFADKHFVLHLDYFVFTVFVEYYYVVDIGTLAYIFIFFQGCAYESFLAVDVQTFVGLGYGSGFDAVETAQHGVARVCIAIFLLKM